MSPDRLLVDLDVELRALGELTTAPVRKVRRSFSRSLRHASPRFMRQLAERLVRRDGPVDRFMAYELIAAHPGAMAALGPTSLRTLGRGIDSWSDVDMFACYLAGPAWYRGSISDAEIARWARSRDRWWRRAALVSTVGLNARARATRRSHERVGRANPQRTLAVCRRLRGDRDPLIVKALSWALRELSKEAPAAVREFVDDNASSLPALVLREVQTKLATGRKARRSPRAASSA